MNKGECRKLVMAKVKLLTKDYKLRASKKVCDKLARLSCFSNSKVVMCYRNTENEIDVDLLALALQKENKLVCFPKMVNDQLVAFYPRNNEFVRGKFDILEPDISSSVQIEKEAIDVIIVPVVAFDKKCHRLGHGKGYYDRYLADYKGLKIGVGFKQQYVKQLPIDDCDIQLDMIITNLEKYHK